MRPMVAAIAGWSIFVLVLLYFDPGFVQTPTCMRLIGRSPECQAIADAWNDAAWRQHTLPLLVLIAAGYAGILFVAITGRRRRTKAESRRPTTGEGSA